MAKELDESYRLFGAKALLKRLKDLKKEIEGVRKAEDIEYVHRMRVASRRIRSALAIFEKSLSGKKVKTWNKQMRRITRALGAARDADVRIDFLQKFLDGLTEPQYRQGIQRLLLRQRQHREGLQGKVIKEMDRLEADNVLEKMERTLRRIYAQARLHRANPHSPYVYEQSYLTISSRLEGVLAYERYVSQPERIEELHLMRIAVKRLRYTMEVLEPLYQGDLKQPLQTVREAQTMLGDIHDCDMWVQYLSKFIEKERVRALEYLGHTKSLNRLNPGILYLQEERQKHRTERYQEFVEFWKKLQGQSFWENLLERISEPRPSEPPSTPDDQASTEKEGNR